MFSILGRGRPCVASLALATLAGAHAPATPQGWHEDPRHGFKLLPPRGWKPIPLKADESWLVAKYLCDSKDRWTDKAGGWTWEHQAELMVIAFVERPPEPPEPEEEARKKAAKDDEGGADGDGEPGEDGDDGEDGITIHFKPYEDYEDYLDRTYAGGGFYVSEREEDVSNELPVTKLEVKVEKLATTGPKRIVTWIFHAQGVDLAVQAEVLEEAYPKHKSTIQSVLRSFKEVPRTMGPLTAAAGADGGGFFISLLAMRTGSPAERKEKRLASEMALHARAKKSLPPSWRAKEHARFLLLYDTDEGFADKVAESAAGLLEWAEKELGFIGPGEYVRRPVLRICASRAEKESLQRGERSSESWGFDSGHEIVTCKDEYGSSGWELEWVNRELIDLWLRERDEQIWLGMPEWVQHGLYGYVAGLRVSGRKVEFKDYRDEYMGFREAVQQKRNIPVRELLQMTSAEFYGNDGNWSGFWNRLSQADMLVRFLLSPEAGRARQTKTLLFDYLRHLRDVVLELEGQDLGQGKAEEAPKTEEEEEEQYREKHKAWQSSEREKEVVKRAFQRNFGAWSPKDWEAFEKAFLKFAN